MCVCVCVCVCVCLLCVYICVCMQAGPALFAILGMPHDTLALHLLHHLQLEMRSCVCDRHPLWHMSRAAPAIVYKRVRMCVCVYVCAVLMFTRKIVHFHSRVLVHRAQRRRRQLRRQERQLKKKEQQQQQQQESVHGMHGASTFLAAAVTPTKAWGQGGGAAGGASRVMPLSPSAMSMSDMEVDEDPGGLSGSEESFMSTGSSEDSGDLGCAEGGSEEGEGGEGVLRSPRGGGGRKKARHSVEGGAGAVSPGASAAALRYGKDFRFHVHA